MSFAKYTTPVDSIPAQMLTYKQKVKNKKEWVIKCVDAFESLGRRQYFDNSRFLENYQMLNGQFIMSHYVEEEGYKDMITALTRELEMPTNLRHFDIIGKMVNNVVERLVDFPDIFAVQETFEDGDTNEYTRTQSDLMHQTVKAQINQEIMGKLQAQGLDPNKQDFQSEEEAQQYQQEIQQMQQAMTPSQIGKYMKTDWKSQGEIWGMHQLTYDRERFNLTDLERDEFRDMLVSDRCFRHFYFTGEGYQQETWNPLNTFFHVSPDVNWTDDGDYVGRITYMSKADIVNRFGWKMDASDLKALETLDKDYSNDLDMSGFPYKTYAPFEDYRTYDIVRRNSGFDPIEGLPMMNDDVLNAVSGNLPNVDAQSGLFRVTEVYWKSQQKLGKVVYIDQETGLLTEDWVDDTFTVPEHFTEMNGDFYDGHEVNTVYWTWVDQVWKAAKLCFALRDADAIYLDMEPLEFQFKGDQNPYNAKLPVCGRIFNNRNALSMSFVDMVKPWQIGANICYNQIFQLMDKEEGKFMIWDVNFFNNLKDWGGEDSFEKVKLIAKELGHVFGDSSVNNMKGGGQNTLPKVADMDLTAQFVSRMKMSQMFEDRALGQFGMTQQTMGQVDQETAEGIRVSGEQTQLNIQKFYTDFFQYKKRCLSMNLDIAQYVQSHKKDFTINYSKSDQSRVFIQMLGTDLLFRQLGIFVVNSQQLMKKLDQIKQVFMKNNTSNASALDIVEVITANSVADIKAKLMESADKQEQKEQQQFQAQQQQTQAEQQIAMEKENRLDQRAHEKNETTIEVAQIAAGAKSKPTPPQAATGGQSDQLAYNQFTAKTASDNRKNDIQAEQNEIQREKQTNQKLMDSKKIELQMKKLQAENKRTKSIVKSAKISNMKKKK
jgi:hypothetical protein